MIKVTRSDPQTIAVTDVIFDSDIYPRDQHDMATVDAYTEGLQAGVEYPPIEVIARDKRLLDGKHRWMAEKNLGHTEVTAIMLTFPGVEPEVVDEETGEVKPNERYEALLQEYATTVNREHGLRTSSEKAKEAVQRKVRAWYPDYNAKALAQRHGVTRKTIDNWIKDIVDEKEFDRNIWFWWLDAVGWTQEEIANWHNSTVVTDVHAINDIPTELLDDTDGTLTQKSISNRLSKKGNISNSSKERFDRGDAPADIADANELPLSLVWAWILEDNPDKKRLDLLEVKRELYSVWNISRADSKFGMEYPGQVPGQLLCNILYYWTEQGDTVVDPFAGGGTTVDACAYMGRTCYAYDIAPARDDILQHDILDGAAQRTSDADLVFLDPPYAHMKQGDYSDDDTNLANMQVPAFLDAVEQIADVLYAEMKTGARIVLIISDLSKDTPDRIPLGVRCHRKLENAGFAHRELIDVPHSTQQYTAADVSRAKKQAEILLTHRLMMVMET